MATTKQAFVPKLTPSQIAAEAAAVQARKLAALELVTEKAAVLLSARTANEIAQQAANDALRLNGMDFWFVHARMEESAATDAAEVAARSNYDAAMADAMQYA
jgi:hypothetical protein